MTRRKPKQPVAPPEPPPPRGRWVAAAAVLVSLLILLGRNAPAETGGAYGALGYTRIVNSLFGPMNWLELGLSEGDDEAGPLVTLSPAAAAQAPVRNFLVHSPLLRDLAARDERLWRISGSHVLGLDPASRRVPGPFDVGGWTGDILYNAAPASAELVGHDSRVIELIRRAGRGAAVETLTALPIVGPPERRSVAEVFEFVDEGGAPLARVRLIGRSVVVFPEPGGGSAEVLVDGASPSPAAGGAARGAVVLPEGGSIRFRRNAMQLGAAFRLHQAPQGLSLHRAFGARVTDTALGSFGDGIEAALISSGISGSDDVRLTLDGLVHLQIQRDLETYSNALLPATGRRPFRAAVTVMDTRSGELLALASYPTRSPPQLREPVPESWLAGNHNFTSLPIGSAAKVPVTAAILSQYPALSTMRIEGSPGGYDRVFGIDLGRTIGEQASAAWVDFPTFLRQSSNKYATALMLMGIASDPWRMGPCRSDPYAFSGLPGIAGGERRFAPEFLLPQVQADRPESRQGGRCGGAFGPVSGSLSSIVRSSRGSDWLSLFRTLFDIPGLEQPPSPDRRFDVGIWGGYARRDDVNPLALAAVSPERESFGLGSIRNFQNDYVSLILGGVRSRWTTVKLAEAYSRIVLGRMVRATLARDGTPVRGGALEGLHPDARKAILSGMEEVARPGGTAHPYLGGPVAALAARTVAGERIRVFAKTGTPSLARSRPIPARLALNSLAARRLLTVEAGNRLVVTRKRPGQSDRAALLAIPELRTEAARFRSSPDAIAREFDRLRWLLAHEPLQVLDADGVVRLPTSQITEEVGGEEIGGGVIALVLARYCSTEQDPGRPIQAVTIVVNVQARQNSNSASRFAAQLLEPGGQVARTLFAPAGRCARDSTPTTGAAP